jgi:hypothetical protein
MQQILLHQGTALSAGCMLGIQWDAVLDCPQFTTAWLCHVHLLRNAWSASYACWRCLSLSNQILSPKCGASLMLLPPTCCTAVLACDQCFLRAGTSVRLSTTAFHENILCSVFAAFCCCEGVCSDHAFLTLHAAA